MKKTILLFGGTSVERLVSVASAQNLANNYNFAEIIFLGADGALTIVSKEELARHADPFREAFTTDRKPFAQNVKDSLDHFSDAVIFLALHGTEGEDGTLQALFESAKICFTGSGAKASKDAFEKDRAKKIVTGSGVATAPHMIIDALPDENQLQELPAFLQSHGKIVLKPIASGSSFGVYIVAHENELNTALEKIVRSDSKTYIIEKFLRGREVTVTVIEDTTSARALCPTEAIISAGHAFDYDGKYFGTGAQEITPAEIADEETKRVQAIALKAHEALGCYGYSRTDMILVDGVPIFLETNTLPGLTKASFVPQQLACSEIAFKDFIEIQLVLAEKRYEK